MAKKTMARLQKTSRLWSGTASQPLPEINVGDLHPDFGWLLCVRVDKGFGGNYDPGDGGFWEHWTLTAWFEERAGEP